jgi:tight adherence protein B
VKPLAAEQLTQLYKWVSYLAVFVGLFGSSWAAAADESGFAWKYYYRYTGHLERRLRQMFIFTPGRIIVFGQAAVAFLLVTLHILYEVPFLWFFLIVVAIGPVAYIEYLRRKRVDDVDKQLDNFILTVANALKTTPSIGAAFQSVAGVIMNPLKQEVELALKEMKVGSSLDQALLQMAARVGSRQLDSTLSAILIGRQVGGNLPKVLETTASNLREMQRLDGVIRTKTADGKMQLWVIGAMPFAMLVGMNAMWPGYFEPLKHSFTGYMIITLCGASWIAALFLARKVLAVDI